MDTVAKSLNKDKYKISIDSINGGISTYEFTAAEDEYYDALGINLDDNKSTVLGRGGGPSVITPTRPKTVTSTAITGPILWMGGAPQTGHAFFAYDMNGSVYTSTGSSVSGVGDLTDGGDSKGNGMAYYNNYMYFARSTTIARYGPLDSADPAFQDDYWVTTLGKTALRNQAYPTRHSGYTDAQYPNHVMFRAKDGRLYFADTVDNQGTIHYIQTTKGTNEGDTDDGSTYNALDLPPGYYVSDIDQLGDDLVIAAWQGNRDDAPASGGYSSGASFEGRAALFFWDRTADSYYRKVEYEFPDQMISALENTNGILYVFSANIGTEPTGVRITRYLGGYSFEQIAFIAQASLPYAGGTASQLNQIYFGSHSNADFPFPCVWAIGSQNQPLSNALFNVVGGRSSSGAVHALAWDDGGAPWSKDMFYAYSDDNTSATVEEFGGSESNWDTDSSGGTNAYWESRWYKIGQRFKITKVRLFINPTTGTDIKVYVDTDYFTGANNATLIGTLDNTNYPSTTEGAIVLRPDALTGNHACRLSLYWHGTQNTPIFLPIEIEYELLDD